MPAHTTPRSCAAAGRGFVCILDLRRERLAHERHLIGRFILCAAVCGLLLYRFGPRDFIVLPSPGDSAIPAERPPAAHP